MLYHTIIETILILKLQWIDVFANKEKHKNSACCFSDRGYGHAKECRQCGHQ